MPTAVTTADRTNANFDLYGRMLVAHIDPAMAVHKNLTYTSTQAGTDVWTPASGKKIAVNAPDDRDVRHDRRPHHPVVRGHRGHDLHPEHRSGAVRRLVRTLGDGDTGGGDEL